MSEFMVSIPGIPGESTATGYLQQIDCQGMRHAVDLPVVATGAVRTEGASRHGAVELTHAVDSASPLLRDHAAAGTLLATVVITRTRVVGGALQVAETITLGNAYIVRVDVDTPFDSATGAPGEDVMETFAMEYSTIKWDYNQYVNGQMTGTVSGEFSPEAQGNAG